MTLAEASSLKKGDLVLWHPDYKKIGCWLLVQSVEIRKSVWTVILCAMDGTIVEDFASNFS